MNSQEMQGNWNQIKGKLKEKWGQLTDDDLRQFNGNTDQLVGVIQQRTGQARSQIESYLNSLVSDGASLMERISEGAREYTGQATDTVRQQYENVSEQLRSGYSSAESTVRNRPVESLAVALGAGLVTGVIIGLLVRQR